MGVVWAWSGLNSKRAEIEELNSKITYYLEEGLSDSVR
jgi:hypothetical protein